MEKSEDQKYHEKMLDKVLLHYSKLYQSVRKQRKNKRYYEMVDFTYRDNGKEIAVKFKCSRGIHTSLLFELKHTKNQFGWLFQSKADHFAYLMEDEHLFVIDIGKVRKYFINNTNRVKTVGSDKGEYVTFSIEELAANGLLIDRRDI